MSSFDDAAAQLDRFVLDGTLSPEDRDAMLEKHKLSQEIKSSNHRERLAASKAKTRQLFMECKEKALQEMNSTCKGKQKSASELEAIVDLKVKDDNVDSQDYEDISPHYERDQSIEEYDTSTIEIVDAALTTENNKIVDQEELRYQLDESLLKDAEDGAAALREVHLKKEKEILEAEVRKNKQIADKIAEEKTKKEAEKRRKAEKMGLVVEDEFSRPSQRPVRHDRKEAGGHKSYINEAVATVEGDGEKDEDFNERKKSDKAKKEKKKRRKGHKSKRLEGDSTTTGTESHADASMEKNIDKAMVAKEEGNMFYKEKDYDNAIAMYNNALDLCPDDVEYDESYAIFLGNRSAAFFCLQEWNECALDCTEALETKPDFHKIRMRRCQAYEKMEKYEAALEDAKYVQSSSPNYPKIHDTVKRLHHVHDSKMEEMKTEAMGKLKDLGNSLLSNFGMSLDQFNFKQNEDGTYSMGT